MTAVIIPFPTRAPPALSPLDIPIFDAFRDTGRGWKLMAATLWAAGYHTLGDLTKLCRYDLIRQVGVGTGTVDRCYYVLFCHDLDFADGKRAAR